MTVMTASRGKTGSLEAENSGEEVDAQKGGHASHLCNDDLRFLGTFSGTFGAVRLRVPSVSESSRG